MATFGNTSGNYAPQADDSQETFIQQQKRLQGAQTAQLTNPTVPGAQTPPPTTAQPASTNYADTQGGQQPPTQASTPVQGDGKIPPPAPPAPAPVPQAPTAQTQQAAAPPAPAPGPGAVDHSKLPQDYFNNIQSGTPVQGEPGLVWQHTGTGWVKQAAGTAPAGQAPAPAAAPGTNTGPQALGSPLQALNLGNNAWSTYTGAQHNVNIPQLGELPQSYGGTQIGQFNSPEQQALTAQQNALMSAILGNPETMNPQVVAQMKEQQKEALLMQEKQMGAMAAQRAAAQGRTNGGGLQSLMAQIQGATGDDIISGNRAVDLAALERNRADQMQALGMSNDLMSGQMNRATQGYGAQLAGQGAQSDIDRNAAQDAIQRAIAGNDAGLRSSALQLQQSGMNADEGFRQYQSEFAGQQADQNRILQQFGMNEAQVNSGRADSALALQGELGRGGLSLDQQRLNQQGTQFDQSHGLNILQFLEGQRQSDNSLGLGYTQLGANQQGATIDRILQMLRG